MKTMMILTAVAGFASVASAGIDGLELGTGAPPASIGGAAMTPAPFDGRIFSDVTSATDGDGQTISFSNPLSVRKIGTSWSTWSHGYTGNCYYTNGLTSATVGFADGTKAVYLYAEPNPFGVFSITSSGTDGGAIKSFTDGVDGSGGASGWGFFGTGGADVASVTISGDVDFAVGEFGTSRVPAPGSLALLGAAGLLSRRRR